MKSKKDLRSTTVTMRFSDLDKQRLQLLADLLGLNQSQVVRLLINDEVNRIKTGSESRLSVPGN